MKHLRLLFLLAPFLFYAQKKSNIIAFLDAETDVITIEQSITLTNDSKNTWDRVVLMDWANSFSSIETALANRFAEDFKNRFQFASQEDLGKTVIEDPKPGAGFKISRLENQLDIVELLLDVPLLPGASRTFEINYSITIPKDDFTGYGRTGNGEYNLKNWYLHPASYTNGKWVYYSHKDLDDFFGSLVDFTISLHVPKGYQAISNIPLSLNAPTNQRNSFLFEGENYSQADLFIRKPENVFHSIKTNELVISTDLNDRNLSPEMQQVVLIKITKFLTENLGTYPHKELVVSEKFYKESPVYGLSSLPDFINPFPDGFSFEMRMLKALTRKWLDDGLRTNPREEFWLNSAIGVYTIMDYQKTFYPELKIGGKFSEIWGLRSFNAAKLKLNDRYALLFLNSARLNLDQAITTTSDSLVKYNQELGIPFKAGIGMYYLENYLEDKSLRKTIKQFYQESRSTLLVASDFRKLLNSNTSKNTDWFFEDYLESHVRIDWKIKSLKKENDSVVLKLKNKSGRLLPVPLYILDNDSVLTREWLPPFAKDTVVKLPRKRANRIALNYEQLIPEFSQRDNYKTLKSLPSLNRPLRLKLFKDVEDPTKTEVFVIPDTGFNVYDGITIGPRFYNGNLLPKPFKYSIKPLYGLRSERLLGSISFRYSHPLQDRTESLYQVSYGASGSTFSYAEDLQFRRASAFLALSYRPEDLRSNLRQTLSFRNILVNRDRDPNNPIEDPDYNVFAINWSHSDPNLKRFFSYNVGTEISQNFGKLNARVEWRKLFKDDRQLNLRFYAGTFLYNDTSNNGDFFSFALDRPTDYLFDFNYYARSEDSGFFSQQLIIAEGGFKSRLDTPFANEWITTVNSSYSIWQYIYAYGDVGFVKNRGVAPQFVYDSGIRLNLLQDFFEVYFPVYSNNGYEIAQPDYAEKIRLVLTLELNLFIKLFNRRWY